MHLVFLPFRHAFCGDRFRRGRCDFCLIVLVSSVLPCHHCGLFSHSSIKLLLFLLLLALLELYTQCPLITLLELLTVAPLIAVRSLLFVRNA